MAVHPAGKFAYVTNAGSNDVSMYTIDGHHWSLNLHRNNAGRIDSHFIAIHPSGKFAYVTNSGSNDISMYGVDATTGLLTLIGTTGL